jgi:hypothetical protein
MAEQPLEDGERRQDARREETNRRGAADRRYTERRVAERRTKDLAHRTVESNGPGKTVGRDRRAPRNGATKLGGASPIAEMASLDVSACRTFPPPGPIHAREATCLRMTISEVRYS